MPDQFQNESTETSELVFVGRLEERDIVNMRWYINRVIWRLGFRYFVMVMIALSVGMIVVNGDKRADVAMCSTIVILFLVVAIQPLDRWYVIRNYRRHPERCLVTTVTLNENRIRFENDSYTFDSQWKIVARIAETKEGFLFMTARYAALCWLPERVLDAEKRATLRQIAEKNKIRILTF